VKEEFFLHLPRKMEPIEGSETSAFKPQTPGKYSKENIIHKSVPLHAWSGPEGSRKLRFPDFIYNGTGWW
jgi:hypothetical protein